MLIALAYVLLLAIVSLEVPLALSLRARVNAEVRSQAQGQADLIAASAADLLSPTQRAALAALARSAAGQVRGRVLIVNGTGAVLADSAGTGQLGRSYAGRPELSSALAGRPVQVQRQSSTLGQQILATAVPVVRRGVPIGAVRITQSVGAVRHAVRSAIAALALIGAVVLALGLTAGTAIAGQVARPLRRLERVARRVASGDLDARATVEGSREQRSLSESFNEMTTRIGRLVRSQRDFVADASHQLRTPLTGLRLRLEEARAAGVGPGPARELDAGLAEVDRLSEIVDELLVLSRAGERELPTERLELSDLASRSLARWQATAEDLGIELLPQATRDGVAWGARADIDRALDALIDNALRYSPRGGRVTVSVAEGAIEVADRGPGLAEGEEDLVFERFHRGRTGRSGPPGSGLGLAIAQALSREWGGDVILRRRSGGGTVAILRLQEKPRER